MVDMKQQIADALRSSQITAKEIAENIGENYKTVFGHLTQMKACKLIELLDDKTYVLTNDGISEFPSPPKTIDEIMSKPTNVEAKEIEVIPINEKTANEIKRTVNYDATTPSHYKGKTIQVFDVLNEFLTTEENHGFYVGNIIKYVVRFKGKNGKEDLLKAREYLNKLIDSL
jgi:hypothetical protein